MPGITKKQFNSIQNVVRHGKTSVKLGDTWNELHREWHVGLVQGGELKFSDADRERLRRFTITETGLDPMNEDLGGDRLQMAQKVINEKWSTEPVFGSYVQIIATVQPIQTESKNIEIPPGSILSIPVQQLDISSISHLIVVENGAVATNWVDYESLVPVSLKTALVVYRGHDRMASGLKTLLKTLPSQVVKVGYFDLDPAGISIAISSEMDAILIPSNLGKLLHKNNRECFSRQYEQYAGIAKKVPEGWKSIWEWIIENGASITQEAMLVEKSLLTIVPRMR